MASSFIDTHPHVISDCDQKYPRAPLFGLQPDWSRERRVTAEALAKIKVAPETFFPKLVSVLGASRLCWGSNFPASEGTLKGNLGMAKSSLATLNTGDQARIFAKTAQTLYPALAD